MKNCKTSKITCVAALVLAGLMACMAADQIQLDRAVVGQGSDPNIGTYYAVAKMTNGTGTFWITPPVGTKTGTFKDASGFGAPYVSALVVTRRSDQQPWYTNNNNSLTFPATNSSYALGVYVTSTLPPPTNGEPMKLQVTWQ